MEPAEVGQNLQPAGPQRDLGVLQGAAEAKLAQVTSSFKNALFKSGTGSRSRELREHEAEDLLLEQSQDAGIPRLWRALQTSEQGTEDLDREEVSWMVTSGNSMF